MELTQKLNSVIEKLVEFRDDLGKFLEVSKKQLDQETSGLDQEQDKINKMNVLMNSDDHDRLMQRRIELHKNMEKPQLRELPVINPFLSLPSGKRDVLLREIFENAKTNVEKFMKDDPRDYEKKVSEEANRLLEVWIESNRKYK